MLKTALLCGALLFANSDAPIETPNEPEIVEPSTGEEETTPTFEEKVYTFKEEKYSAIITLTSEKDYSVETTYNDGKKETTTGTYTFEENKLTLYTNISLIKWGDFTINEDGSLTKIVPEYEIPTNKDEAVEVLKTWLETWASPEMVTMIVLGSALLIILAVYLFKDAKNKKIRALTNEDLEKSLEKFMETEIGKEIKGQVEQFIPEILARLETQNDVLKTFAKIMCLAQENTPESRVAILELIQNLGVIDKSNVEASKKIVEEKEAEKVEKAQKQDDELTKIIEDTEKKDDGTTI